LRSAAEPRAMAVGMIPVRLNRTLQRANEPVAQGRVDQPAAPRPAHPLRVERQVARVADDGVIGTANGVPVQLLHYSAIRQIWYFDPRTGKKLQVTVPRDQAFLVPVRTF